VARAIKPSRWRFARLWRCPAQIPVRLATSAYVKIFWLALTVIIILFPHNLYSPSNFKNTDAIQGHGRNISCHLYGANSQYFQSDHTSGTPRQKTIVSVASTWVPEMLNSGVASRRANMRLSPVGLVEKCRPTLSLIGPLYLRHLACQERAAEL
jgi:hypothetical protein